MFSPQVSSLLRLASVHEHLYLLNHLLRCPAGLSKWGAQLVQLPDLSCPGGVSAQQHGFGGAMLDHTVTVLATVLLPPRSVKYWSY